ncbi:MAG: 3-oxoacyl-ACP synthase [Clostridium sp. SCN 57-10]|nr:MAG: 3-oxoacyl-ACP synthase [Clostridium sp. SCN 57-10]
MNGLQILGLGHAVPDRVVTNDELARTVDTSDEWIVSRTGIRERRFAAEDESNASLASRAATRAIECAGIDKNDIAFCVVATFTPDLWAPATASRVAQMLALPEHTVAFDMNGGCTGFVYALTAAHGLLAAHGGEYALVIGSEIISRMADMTDRSTCVLFGDGAGAAVVRLSPDHPFCFSGGGRPDETVLYCPIERGIRMDGSEVYRFATVIVPQCIQSVLSKSGKTLDDVHHIVCHQANARIIEQAARRLGVDADRFYLNLQRYGNTSAASIPLALSEMRDEGLLTPGKTVVCAGFGAGLTYGAMLLTF